MVVSFDLMNVLRGYLNGLYISVIVVCIVLYVYREHFRKSDLICYIAMALSSYISIVFLLCMVRDEICSFLWKRVGTKGKGAFSDKKLILFCILKGHFKASSIRNKIYTYVYKPTIADRCNNKYPEYSDRYYKYIEDVEYNFGERYIYK